MTRPADPDHQLIRGQLIDGLRQTGAKPEIAEQIADLAIHAAEQAILIVHRICAPLGGTNGMSAGLIAYQLIEELAQTNAQTLAAKLQSLPGIRTMERQIGRAAPASAAAGSTQ